MAFLVVEPSQILQYYRQASLTIGQKATSGVLGDMAPYPSPKSAAAEASCHCVLNELWSPDTASKFMYIFVARC